MLLAPLAGAAAPKDPAQVIEAIKTLLPKGLELAGAYDHSDFSQVVPLTSIDYQNAVAKSYMVLDLTKGGQEVLLVAAEYPPTSDADGPSLGERVLLVFRKDASGVLKKVAEGPKVIMNGDSGGMQGDPFQGFTSGGLGVFKIYHEGGSSEQWSVVQTFAFRGKEIYLTSETQTGKLKTFLKSKQKTLLHATVQAE